MLDAIIISDSGDVTLSASSPLRLQIDGKIALIQNVKNYLDNKGEIVYPIKGENEKNWHCAPKLNGVKLSSYLQMEGYNIGLIDSFYQERDDFIKLLEKNPKALIISTTFILNKKALREFVDDIRSIAPDIFIIAGGPLVYSSYLLLQRSKDNGYDVTSPKDDFLFLSNDNRPDIDLYIIDKCGEQILSEALRQIKNNSKVHDLPKTAQWNGQQYIFSPRRELPPTDINIHWNEIDDKVFRSGVINIQASIGCPFHCEFCNFVKDSKYTFVKPLDQLIKELKAVSDKGIKYVRFVDDNFRLGKNDLNEVCKRFIDEGLDIKWMSFIRASVLKKTDLELLKQAGCVETQMGIESADKTVLRKMNKHADPDMYYNVISNLLDIGINCSCCFIVGFPGETKESFHRTVDFIERIPKDSQEGIFYWSIYPFLFAPLSPIYEPVKRKKYHLKGYMDKWEHSTMNSDEAYEHVKEAFLKIENSTPIYSGDNIDMLLQLPPEKRKKFIKVRHEMSKRFLREPFDQTLLIESFSKVLKNPEA